MSNAYDPTLRGLVLDIAEDLGLSSFVHPEGTYFFVSGPSYETGAESAMIRGMGGDVVGMSTVPEVVVARHCGMRVLGLSMVTNKVVLPGDTDTPVASHGEVLEAVAMRTDDMQLLVLSVLKAMGSNESTRREDQIRRRIDKASLKQAYVDPFKRLKMVQVQETSLFQRILDLKVDEMTSMECILELARLKDEFKV